MRRIAIILLSMLLFIGADISRVVAGDITIVVMQSDGVTPLNGVKIDYQYGSGGRSTILAASDNNHIGTRTITTSGNLHRFHVTWRNTEFIVGPLTRNVSDPDDTIYIYSTGVTFKATSHGNVNVPGVSLRYTAGGSVANQTGSTDANGEYKIEMFPGTYPYHKGINAPCRPVPLQ